MACNKYKTFYDTEFEAILAASRRSFTWRADITHYQCGTHWHITNTATQLRNKHVRESHEWCEDCKTWMKPGRWERHKQLAGHIKAQKKTS